MIVKTLLTSVLSFLCYNFVILCRSDTGIASQEFCQLQSDRLS